MLEGVLLGLLDGSDEAPLLVTHRNDVRPQAPYELHSLLAHPIRHEYRHMMAQRPPYGREGDPRVSTGGLDDGVSRLDLPGGIGVLQDVQGHAVFDAGREIHVLGLGVDHPLFPVVDKADLQQRRVADEVPKPEKARLRQPLQSLSLIHHSPRGFPERLCRPPLLTRSHTQTGPKGRKLRSRIVYWKAGWTGYDEAPAQRDLRGGLCPSESEWANRSIFDDR